MLRYSVYCVEPAERTVPFVETPAEVDLQAEPFFHAAQFRHARAVVELPFERVLTLAKKRPAHGGNLGL